MSGPSYPFFTRPFSNGRQLLYDVDRGVLGIYCKEKTSTSRKIRFGSIIHHYEPLAWDIHSRIQYAWFLENGQTLEPPDSPDLHPLEAKIFGLQKKARSLYASAELQSPARIRERIKMLKNSNKPNSPLKDDLLARLERALKKSKARRPQST